MTAKPRPPHLVIRLAVEAAPTIHVSVANQSEWLRLVDWLESHPEINELGRRAHELSQRAKAA